MTLTPDLTRTLEGPFSTLSESAGSMADLAAVCGQRQELWLLRSASELESDVFASAILELTTAGVLSEPTGPAGDTGTLEFAHPLLQKARYDGLGVVRRRELHSRLAHAMESRAGEEPRWVPALATHVALGVGDDEGGADGSRHLILAGERALDLQANREATRFFRLALKLASGPEELERGRVGLGRALLRLGEFEEAMASFGKVLDAAGEAHDSSDPDGRYWQLDLIAADDSI